MDIALRFSAAVKTFGKCRALDGLDLVVPAGVALGLVGRNGAGKTTSFAVAAGLMRLRSGTVDLFASGPFDARLHAGRVAVMPQDTNFPAYVRVQEVLAYFAHLQGIPRSNVAAAVSKVLDWVHLGDRAAAPMRTLSHGMRRRVVIAQAFLGDPDLVLLDEPMSGLDPREVVNIRDLLKARPGHQTVIISSHNLHEVERICDHVAFIAGGKLVRQSSMDDVTGRHHMVAYHVSATDAIDVGALEKRCPPGVVVQVTGPDTFTCRFLASNQRLETVNAIIVPYLLDRAIGILGIRPGTALEAIYMQDSAL